MREPIRKLDRKAAPKITKPVRLVVAALILRGGGTEVEVLICQRKADQPMSLEVGVPGGKIESGESAENALARELDEELGIAAVIGSRVARVRHKYRNGGTIDLQFFTVREFQGEMENRIL